MVIWVIITTSLLSERYDQRKLEYIGGIKNLLNTFKDRKYNIVIVENTSKLNNPYVFRHKTFLNNFNVPVLYTKNNLILQKTTNYGVPEMLDVLECIKHFNIQDDDFIIKATGRYFLDEQSAFFNIVDNLENKSYDAIARFNQYDMPVSLKKEESCVTGIIGLRCKYVKQIQLPDLDDKYTSIEMKWAELINKLDDSQICFMEKLDLFIKPKMLWDFCYIKI